MGVVGFRGFCDLGFALWQNEAGITESSETLWLTENQTHRA